MRHKHWVNATAFGVSLLVSKPRVVKSESRPFISAGGNYLLSTENQSESESDVMVPADKPLACASTLLLSLAPPVHFAGNLASRLHCSQSIGKRCHRPRSAQHQLG